jgi:hypothetical protein
MGSQPVPALSEKSADDLGLFLIFRKVAVEGERLRGLPTAG